jgi:hypothetical protein
LTPYWPRSTSSMCLTSRRQAHPPISPRSSRPTTAVATRRKKMCYK